MRLYITFYFRVLIVEHHHIRDFIYIGVVQKLLLIGGWDFMSKQINVSIPEWFELDGLTTLQVVISPNREEVGILLAGENLDLTKTCCPTVRLYLVNMINGKFEITKELDAFTFESKEEALQFAQSLPEITAMDLVMMLNKQSPVFSVQ